MVKKLYSNYTKLYSNISIILYISPKLYSNSKRYMVKYEISNSSCSIAVAYSYYICVSILSSLLSIWQHKYNKTLKLLQLLSFYCVAKFLLLT